MRLKVNPVVKVEILEPFPDEVDVTDLGLFKNPWLQLSEFVEPLDCAHCGLIIPPYTKCWWLQPGTVSLYHFHCVDLPEGPLGHFLKSLDRP